MKIRDTLNSELNYSQTIEKKIGFVKRDSVEYKEVGNDWQSDRVYSHFARTFMYQYQIIISKYSLGLPVMDLVEDYKQSIIFMKKGWRAESGYVQMVWMLSIGIMLEIEQEYFDKLVNLVERDSLQDYLVDFLI
ncbi:MAG: PoNe immunity protein domain-containing protein, partial [Moheibacter sp.]